MSASTQLESGVTGDAELISSARSGDTAAIGALYERHAGAAWVVARQYSDSPDGRRRRRRGLVHRRLRCHRAGQRARVGVPRVPLHRRAPRGRAAPREEPSRPADGRHRRARGRHRPGRHRGGAGARRLRAGGRRARVPLAARAVAGRAVAHRGRGPDAGGDRAHPRAHRQRRGRPGVPRARGSAAGVPPAAPAGPARRRAAGPSPASSAPTSAAGWARARPAQVEAHLEDCGTCRGLLLELGDVNHGMRAVIAPLVLGLLGLGALGVALPVGGGLAAGAAAAAAAARCGAVRVRAAWRPAARRQRVPRRRPGRSPRSAPERRGGAAAAGGVAAFLAAIPLGVAAAVVGGVALAAVAAVAILNLLGVAGRRDVAAPEPTSSDVPQQLARSRRPARRSCVPTPQPTDIPTPEPSDLPTDDDLVLDDEDDVDDVAGDVTADGPADTATTRRPRRPDDPDGPVVPTPTDPPAPAPASVSVDVPPGGLTLEAGLGGQELVVGLLQQRRNGRDEPGRRGDPAGRRRARRRRGRRARRARRRTLRGDGCGRLAVRPSGEPVSTVARCTLDRLPALSTSTLVLRVSIDESFDQADGEIGLRVMGAGIDYVAPPIRVAIAPSPARLALRSRAHRCPAGQRTDAPAGPPGREHGRHGRSPPVPGAVSVHLPTGVTGATVPGSSWICTGATPLVCRPGAVAARADAPLSLLLSAAPDRGPDHRPAGRRAGAERAAAPRRPSPCRSPSSAPPHCRSPGPGTRDRRRRHRPRPCRCASRTRATCPRRASPSRSAGPRVSPSGRRPVAPGAWTCSDRLGIDRGVHHRGDRRGRHAWTCPSPSRRSPGPSAPSAP